MFGESSVFLIEKREKIPSKANFASSKQEWLKTFALHQEILIICLGMKLLIG